MRRWFWLLRCLAAHWGAKLSHAAWEGLTKNRFPENVHSAPTEKSGTSYSAEEEVKGGSTWGRARNTGQAH